ncbi:aminotransferase [Novosphingobium sp. Rr 2-17]|uniref:aminotransferase class III-fold pyridoxal phosphate-dependent enzyme n=1 Tax=Novosphingobium sp. Rr 2-17 TaxID=555793 RepID=UPI0002697E41|nr:aminotransferase class III-fold pyridoxal phosphate-dependent enzyme [Novosphingobium sp. Rr 2-17]EIZ81223.1 aminotransferase [Novosphingobium sp. Rr 2-17]
MAVWRASRLLIEPWGAGLLTRHDVVEEFGRNSRYFNTFAGNAVSCAAAAAVLKAIKRDRIMDNARDVGAYLRCYLTLKL